MNSLPPNDSRQALEAQITALLLGELSSPDAAELKKRIAADPQLQQLHDRLKSAALLIQEASAVPQPDQQSTPPAPKLSSARRDALLAKFKTVEPTVFTQKKSRPASWLVPTAIAACLLLLAGALLLPALSPAKSRSMRMASATDERIVRLKPESEIENSFRLPAQNAPASEYSESARRRLYQTVPAEQETKIAPMGKGLVGGAAGAERFSKKSTALADSSVDLKDMLRESESLGRDSFGVAPAPSSPSVTASAGESRGGREAAVFGGYYAVPPAEDHLAAKLPEENTARWFEITPSIRGFNDDGFAGQAAAQPTIPTRSLGEKELASSELGALSYGYSEGDKDWDFSKGLPAINRLGQNPTEAGKPAQVELSGIKNEELLLQRERVLSETEAKAKISAFAAASSPQPPAAEEPALVTPLDALTQRDESLAKRLQDRPAIVYPPEIPAVEQPFSTFSLNVSDVSYRLAFTALNNGQMPDPATVRAEEFINAFDYRDPLPVPGSPVTMSWERARYPFAQNRDILRIAVKTAGTGRENGQPLNLVLLLDNSGSMERSDRVRIIREALRVLGTKLQPRDTLSILTFSRTPTLRADGVSGEAAVRALAEISGLTPEGGTNLEEALRAAYSSALRHYVPGGLNRVVLLTDGAANLGDVQPERLKAMVEDFRKRGVALDCFGVGFEGYDDEMLETLSRNGDGRYAFLNTPEAAATEFAAKLAGALQVAASDVKVQVEFNPHRVATYRQIGYAKHQLTREQFRDNTVDAAEIGALESGNALYTVELKADGSGPIGTVRVRFKTPGTSSVQEHEWAMPYTGQAPSLQQASPALRLATAAAGFAEWLAANPWAAEITPDRLTSLLEGVPPHFAPDPRPNQLLNAIRQAKSISGR